MEFGIQTKELTSLRNCINCPHCKISKGEQAIIDFLDEHNIDYEYQKRFDDCKNKNVLAFDFYINDLNIIIEYDGEQHFKPVRFLGMTEEESIKCYEDTVKRDCIKNDYCINNNISIIRIPYYDFNNINKILKEKLQLLK